MQTPFKPERPAEPEEGLRSVGVQDVDARLWQDPFAAVVEARKGPKGAPRRRSRSVDPWRSAPTAAPCWCAATCPGRRQPRDAGIQTDPHDWTDLKGQILTPGIEALSQVGGCPWGHPPVTVLGIMVSAGPSPGAAETRRRYRYAALSALMLEEFLPDDAEHVGYADGARGPLPDSSPTSGSPASPKVTLIPDPGLWCSCGWTTTAWLPQSSPTGARKALQNQEKPHPLARLSALLNRIAPETGVGFQVIGPAASGTLEVMADEYARQPTAWSVRNPGDPKERIVRIWSPFATIPSISDAPVETKQQACADNTKPSLRLPSPVHRTIASDDVLAKMLVAELGRRQVAGNAGIALIGQWDTAYSRRLASLVEGAWYHAQCEQRTVANTFVPDRASTSGHTGRSLQLHARPGRPDPRRQAQGPGIR